MTVIVKITLWDMEGTYYVGAGPCLVDNRLLASHFSLCTAAWEAFASLKGLGNIKEASLVEVV